MAHPDKTRHGSEKGQGAHAGQTSRVSDAGMQARSQHGRRGGQASSPASGTEAAKGTPQATAHSRGNAAAENRQNKGGKRKARASQPASPGQGSSGGTGTEDLD